MRNKCGIKSLVLRPIIPCPMRQIFCALFAFASLLTSLPAVAQQAPQLQFGEETYNFGTIGELKGPVVHEFVFTNNSSRPVKILKVQASCGCTTPAWSKEIVKPGGQGFIQARYDPKGRPGFFTKSLT